MRNELKRRLETRAVETVKPYALNPRRNDEAVPFVAESIKQCGYVSPIVVDESGEILAGHTRFKAVQSLGWKEIPVLVVEGLSDAQKRKFRILDNKVGEKAGWDFDLLQAELADLDFGGFDFGLGEGVFEPSDDFFADAPEKEDPEAKKKVVTCPHCGKNFEV